MRIVTMIVGLGLTALLAGAVPTAAQAQGSTAVVNVIGIDTGGDLPGFIKLYQRAQKINERLGTNATTRIWQATHAGDQTGSVVIANEYKSLEAMAQALAKQAADPEWQKLITDFQKKMSATSNTVHADRTP